MLRITRSSILLSALLALSACGGTIDMPDLRSGFPSSANSQAVQMTEAQRVQLRMLRSVNALREAAGLSAVRLDDRLTSAARRHSSDMSAQNRAWHFGSDGSSPLSRMRQAGYTGTFLGETISETYEDDQETLAAWMIDVNSRKIIQNPHATRMGFAWHKDPSGKTWWTMMMAK